ncbi:tyrosine-type recombinase/integrase [Roseomonas sp. WA12]
MLTDRKVKEAKKGEKPVKLPDANGLHLMVSTTGAKLWRFRYRFGGGEKLLAIGAYPEISLAAAREERDRARALLREGRDPSIEKRLRKVRGAAGAANTLEAVARAWHALQSPHWTPHHVKDVMRSLEGHVFPVIGALPISEVSAPVLLRVLRTIEARPAVETAHRVRQRLEAIFLHAMAEGICTENPAAVMKAALQPVDRGRQPAIITLDGARSILADAESIPAQPTTKLALRFLALTSVRPGELRGAQWSEFRDLDGGVPLWDIPPERMKMKAPHQVPLSRQAVETLRAIRPLTGRYPFVFNNVRSAHRPMSEASLNKLLQRSGYADKHVPHGWRAAFSSIMNERHRQDRAVIDLMLAHAPKDKVEAAYNQALHMEWRRELAQEWGDILMAGKPPALSLLNMPRR